jgi:hypothetical protein
MSSPSEQLTVEVHVGSPETFHEELDPAVAAAPTLAFQKGRGGILLTRHSYTHVTAETSDEVPSE